MTYFRVTGLAAVLASALAGYSATAAKADVATRCDWRGCSHIVCNWTGDRCHRYSGDRYYRDGYYRGDYDSEGYYRDGYDGDDGYNGRRYRHDDANYRNGYGPDRGWRYDCDRDADNCYIRRSGYDD